MQKLIRPTNKPKTNQKTKTKTKRQTPPKQNKLKNRGPWATSLT
jgi:hypothetical protein